jgi:5'-methylthioadenosine phosphorylase
VSSCVFVTYEMISAMGRLALVGGHGFGSMTPWAEAPRTEVETERGGVELLEVGDHVVLARHGIESYTPAQRLDHARNLAALAEAGCDRVLATCSVGSLDLGLEIGTYLCPDDFISLARSDAAFDDRRGHVVPAFDPVWRRLVIEAWAAAGTPLRDQGVYWQTLGPRFETPAEVRLIARHADVVGMTMASECTIACQFGLAYAAVCVVDNYANGLGPEPLSPDEFEATQAENWTRLASTLQDLLPALASPTQ